MHMSIKKTAHEPYLLPLAGLAFFFVTLSVLLQMSSQPQRLNSKAAPPNEKVNICHVPPGNPNKAVVVSVSANAWENGHDLHNSHSLDYVITDGRHCPEVDE